MSKESAYTPATVFGAGKSVSKAALKTTRASIYRWFLFQGFIVLAVGLVVLMIQGVSFAWAVLIGGFICILPNLLFARWWFDYYRANAVRKLLARFFFAELLKLCIVGMLFVLAVVFLQINALGCLLGFIVAQVAFWLAPLIRAVL